MAMQEERSRTRRDYSPTPNHNKVGKLQTNGPLTANAGRVNRKRERVASVLPAGSAQELSRS